MSALSDPDNVWLVDVDARTVADTVGMSEDAAYAYLSGAPTAITAATAAMDADTDATEDVIEMMTGMIALVPSLDDQARLYVEGYEAPDELHLTLVYMGDITAWGTDVHLQINTAVQTACSGQSALTANAFGAAIWNPGGDNPCVVLNVGGAGLEDVRCAMQDALEGIWSVDDSDEYEPWSPHVCLAYTSDIVVIADAVKRVGPITFDRVRVALGDDVVDHPLYATAMTAAVESATEAPDQTAWEGILMVEGVETGDGREFAPGSITWATPWLPLRWAPADFGAHQGAVDVARIDEIWRDVANPNIIRARGVFNTTDETAARAFAQVRDGFLKGVSVDVDSVAESDIEYIFAPNPDITEGDETVANDPVAMLFGQAPEKMVMHAGRIRGATLVSLPAFVEAQIQLVNMPTAMPPASGEGEMPEMSVLTASVNADPPREWFEDPKLSGPTPLTITDDGRVFGHAALFGTCHIGVQDRCVQPPYEASHDFFSLGERDFSDGSTIPVGSITLGTGHASTYGLTAAQALEHYDNTGTRIADVVTGNDQYGIWVAGAICPGATEERVAQLRAAKLSGDWRRIGGQLRLVALLAVNVPGFPVPRLSTSVSVGRQLSLVASGIVTDDAVARNVSDERLALRTRMAVTRLEQLRKRMKTPKKKSCSIEGDE